MKNVTLRAIREFAQQQIAAGKSFDDWDLDRTMQVPSHVLNNIVFAEAPEYLWDVEYNVSYEFSEQGVLMAQCYPFSAVDEMKEKREKMFRELWDERGLFDLCGSEYSRAMMKLEGDVMAAVPFPEPEFTVEVPLAHGYSDTSRRDETKFSLSRINLATEEAIREHLGIQKVQPWELRDMMQATGMISDLGMEEEEVDELIEAVCA